MIEFAWLIPVFPFAAFVVISFVTRRWKQLSGYVAVAGILAAFLLALPVFGEVLAGAHIESASSTGCPWRAAGPRTRCCGWASWWIPLTAMMLVVVTPSAPW